MKLYQGFFLAIIILSSQLLSAQCDCPSLPDDQGKIYEVSNMFELTQAMRSIEISKGNATVIMDNGTYLLKGRVLYIKSTMPNVSFRSKSGNRNDVIIKGDGYNGATPHVFLVSASNFTLADLTLGWVANHGVQINGGSDADNALVQNVRFVNTQEQMLKVTYDQSTNNVSNNGLVQCCLFEFPDGVAHQYYTGGVDAHAAVDWVLRNNTFRNIRSPESNLAEHAIHFWTNSKNTLVENNLITNCDRGIGFGLGSRGHQGGRIQNNFVHTSRDVGIGLENASNVEVFNNTVHTENYFNSIEYRFDSSYNAQIVNNLTTQKIASRQGGTGVLKTNEMVMIRDYFVNANENDYHLAYKVPDLVDQGTDISDLLLDFDCHDRVSGMGIDIGADEFNSVSTGELLKIMSPIFKIFPNPNNGSFSIKSSEEVDVEIFSVFGELLYKNRSRIGINEITLNNHGVFFVRLSDKGSIVKDFKVMIE